MRFRLESAEYFIIKPIYFAVVIYFWTQVEQLLIEFYQFCQKFFSLVLPNTLIILFQQIRSVFEDHVEFFNTTGFDHIEEIREKKGGDETLAAKKFTNFGVAVSRKGAVVASVGSDFLRIFLFLFALVVFKLRVG